jgi:hypothetical protein
MGATRAADFAFSPKVWQDHISAYFDKKLAMGQFALRDRTLAGEPGNVVDFPYFKAISAAEEPDEDSGLIVDKLQDDSFSCTIKEVAKAVGVKKRAIRKSAARRERIFGEAQEQIARVHAEKVDADLITEINTSGNYVAGFVAASSTADLCKINNVVNGRIVGFGDKQDQTIAQFIHSYHLLDLLTDSTAGFLKADANMPFWGMPGFQGMLLGAALIVNDNMPRLTDISSKRVYASFSIKANAYGILQAEDMEMEQDYDMLHREYVFAGCQYYAVKAFHAKVASNDYRIARHEFCTSIAT